MKKRLIILSFATLFVCSCGKFLSPYSPTEYTPKTVESLKESLVGVVYMDGSSTNNASIQTSSYNLFEMNEFMSDNVEVRDEALIEMKNSEERFSRAKDIYCLDPMMFEIAETTKFKDALKTWKKHFEKILGCNVIFDYIDEVRGTEAQKCALLAEAYFFRAFFYFNFVNTYGEPYNFAPNALGVPIKLTSGYNSEFAKRNSVKEVYDQIISDLNASEENYSKISENLHFQDIVRPSLPLLYVFRSRVALYMENWSEAADYASKLFDSKWNFELYDLNSFNAQPSNPYISYVNMDKVNPETIFAFGCRPYAAFNIIGTLPKKTGANTTNDDWTRIMFLASNDLVNSFDSDDIRATQYLVNEYNLKSVPAGPVDGRYTMYSKVNISTTNSALDTKKDFGMMVRLSEAYLNYSEACVKLGKEALAVTKLAELRAKRYKAGSAQAVVPVLTGNQLLDFVHAERRRELCFEGHRWFDLRRYGVGFSRKWYENGQLLHTINVEPQDAAKTLLLTPDVMNNNHSLVQNRIWDRKY